MKIYVAGHNQEEAVQVAGILEDAGHSITSRWLGKAFDRTSVYSEDERTVIAQEDAEDVLSADLLVLLSSPFRVSGGKFVEAGVALGAGKMVLVIGARENMLMWHPMTKQFATIESAIPYLASMVLIPGKVYA